MGARVQGIEKKRQERGKRGLHSVMAMMVDGMCARTVPESQGRGDRYETCSQASAEAAAAEKRQLLFDPHLNIVLLLLFIHSLCVYVIPFLFLCVYVRQQDTHRASRISEQPERMKMQLLCVCTTPSPLFFVRSSSRFMPGTR